MMCPILRNLAFRENFEQKEDFPAFRYSQQTWKLGKGA
jgi:hypothetical protein